MEDRNKSIDKYVPVGCSFIDEVEIIATRKMEVEISICTSSNSSVFISKIKTWFTKESIEYLQFQGGVFVRMDKIDSFDGKKIADSSCYL